MNVARLLREDHDRINLRLIEDNRRNTPSPTEPPPIPPRYSLINRLRILSLWEEHGNRSRHHREHRFALSAPTGPLRESPFSSPENSP